jgi:hypothetical protein
MLKIGALYVVLYARATPNDYHWALYHHWSSSTGTKFHIRNVGSTWFAGHEPNSGIMKDFLLMGLMKIAYIQPGVDSTKALHTVITAVPYDSPTVTCRTWVLDALRSSMSAGLVQQFSIDQLEMEAKSFGFTQFDDTAENMQPRPIVTFSKIST